MRLVLTPKNTLFTLVDLLLFWSENIGVNYTIITLICVSLFKRTFYSFMRVELTPRVAKLGLNVLLE